LEENQITDRRPKSVFKEEENEGWSAGVSIVIFLSLMAIGIVTLVVACVIPVYPLMALAFPCLLAGFIIPFGLFTVETNTAILLSLCGEYKGSSRRAGIHCNNPCYQKKKIDLGIRNFETPRIKVNDKNGTPVLI